MKKLVQSIAIVFLGCTLLTNCKSTDPTPTALASVGTNVITSSIDVGTISKQIYVSGLSGKIHEVKVNFQGSGSYTEDLELYLKSPSGKILQLCADETEVTGSGINVTFTDAASTSITNFTSANSSNMSGTFRPRGSLNAGYEYTGTITSFAGYKNDTPNGTWTLYISDDLSGGAIYFSSWELFLSTVN